MGRSHEPVESTVVKYHEYPWIPRWDVTRWSCFRVDVTNGMLRARADSEVRDPARLAACSLRSLSQVGIVEPRSPTQLGTVTQSQVGADRQARWLLKCRLE